MADIIYFCVFPTLPALLHQNISYPKNYINYHQIRSIRIKREQKRTQLLIIIQSNIMLRNLENENEINPRLKLRFGFCVLDQNTESCTKYENVCETLFRVLQRIFCCFVVLLFLLFFVRLCQCLCGVCVGVCVYLCVCVFDISEVIDL
jgi:hypothetical protein